MDCFQDFCLYCDRDSPADGAYCSQRCKLADLHRSSNPSSPTFSSARTERNWTQAGSTSSSSRPPSSHMWSPQQEQQQQQQQQQHDRQLTPSSSRTSLSSTSSHITASGSYSTDAKAQLNDYFSSFDQAKAAKRRSSTR